ncbi:MAG: class I SAM-dependent methyltransferase, partial [Planctomycetaceae bacterium]|nr:class I SAM-dependent methyltransferase [Planctomycetaceae bacterium]
SMVASLPKECIRGKKFIDVGCGSGLSSLVARRLGATVHSFDFDTESVECTRELKRRYFQNDSEWTIDQGSVLNQEYLQELGTFDVVYSWGVLHHTNEMWTAIENAISLVNERGSFFISIYNDQGGKSDAWRALKKLYCSGRLGRLAACSIGMPILGVAPLVSSVYQGKNLFRQYSQRRGMSMMTDWFDWLGGYPFEVATPEQIVQFCLARGFQLTNLRTTNGHGTNEFVLRRNQNK